MKVFICFILFSNLFIIFGSGCNLSNSVCQYNNDKELKCFGYKLLSSSNKFQPFYNIMKQNYTITKLHLENICLAESNLNQFKNLTALKLIECSESELNESIFTVHLGSTLKDLEFKGNYTFSTSPFRHLAELSSLSFIFNYQLSDSLTKEFFSPSLSKLSSLRITHSGISKFDGDMFANLKNLKTLTIFMNPLTEFPTAIQYIPSLKKLEAGYHDDIEVLKRPFETTLYNLEELELSHMEKLKSIENCAFCSFPNLKSVLLGNNENLTWIHQNSFGALLPSDNKKFDHKIENMEILNIENCNVSVLHESLLNWKNLKHLQFGNNKFICNCSISWLIEDIQSSNPFFSNNLKTFIAANGHKTDLTCYGPEEIKGKRLKDLSTSNCKQLMTAEKEETKSSKMMWFLFGFFMAFAIVMIVIFAAYCNHFIYFSRNQRSIVEHFKLNELNDI